jgi:hypothetical protein
MVVLHIPQGGDAAFRAGPHPSCAASIAAAWLPAGLICSAVAPPGADVARPVHHRDRQGGELVMGAAQTREYVDRRYEDRDVSQLPDVPVQALRGLGKRGGEALGKALGVKTIRDLATNDFVLKAQQVLRLAEGPAAVRAVAAAPMAWTGADAVGDQQGPAGQQPQARFGEELEVSTGQVPRGQAGVRKRVVAEPVGKEHIEVDQPDGER